MKRFINSFIFFLVLLLITSACSINPIAGKQYTQNLSKAEVVFNVSFVAGSEMQSGLFVEVLDELSGLGLNPTRYPMQSTDGLTYFLRMSYPMGFVLKYRYVQESTPPLIEYDTQKQQVRYRQAYINGPLAIEDQVAGWQTTPFSGNTGILQGFIFNIETSEPLSNVMVTINGMRTFSGADGSYSIANIPSGEHLLTAVHVDGLFQPFQQKAVIASNAVTPANFGMKPNQLVNITFVISPPAENLAGAPIRLFGSFLSMGNSFADKRGGITTDIAYAKNLIVRDDGSYAVTLSLPAGHPLEYRYSLGDGFWNAERDKNNSLYTRRIIIPAEDTTIHDIITTWRNSEDLPLTFHISVPSNTPAGAIVMIQFNPYVWMEPLPVWNLGNNQWLYVAYGPAEFIRSSNFRIQMIDSGTVNDDLATAGSAALGNKIESLITDINYTVGQWSIK